MTEAMRIGIDYTSAARQRAGIGRYTRELVSALLAEDRSNEYTVFAATGGLAKDRWREEVSRLGRTHGRPLAVRSVPLSDEWLARLWHRLRLSIPVELITGRLDIFYSPDFTLPPTRSNTYSILTVHDLSFVHHPEAFVPPLRRYLERVVPRSIERADVVLADSGHTYSDLVTLFAVPKEKMEVLTPGVDSRFRPEPTTSQDGVPALAARLRDRYAIGQEPYVLSVGTLQPRKNYVRLIEAFVEMEASQRRSGESYQLLIGGGRGWLYEEILEEADKHDRVRVLGYVEEEDLPALYRGAALFAFPSLYEGFGLPVLEAMGCGVPVVCSDTSSLPEVAGEAAILVDPFDVSELAEGMTQALEDDDLRRTLVERGLAQAAKFTWKRSAQQLLDVIARCEEK